MDEVFFQISGLLSKTTETTGKSKRPRFVLRTKLSFEAIQEAIQFTRQINYLTKFRSYNFRIGLYI